MFTSGIRYSRVGVVKQWQDLAKPIMLYGVFLLRLALYTWFPFLVSDRWVSLAGLRKQPEGFGFYCFMLMQFQCTQLNCDCSNMNMPSFKDL